ncbi:hypothetical protein ACFYOT_40490 [Saccharothrix saharensis]|uniref:hypothetical protein n=1 Tax=Saccharothrix saharensis TaxID=571190 RepID=UPI0036AD15C8
MRGLVLLVAVTLLAACSPGPQPVPQPTTNGSAALTTTPPTGPPEVPSRAQSVVWTTREGVFVQSRYASRPIGASAVDGFSWSADGRLAAGLVEPSIAEQGRQLMLWDPDADGVQAVKCPGCQGAVIIDGEVRTAEGNTIHRYAVPDLAPRGDIPIAVEPADPDVPGIPPAVIGATPEFTIVKHAPLVGPKGGPEFILAVDATGAVRWEYPVEGNLGVVLTALDPTGTQLAFPVGTHFHCSSVNTRLVVLDLATGRTAHLPEQPRPDTGNTTITDVWWNGPELVVPTATTPPTPEADCDVRSTLRLSVLAGRRWRTAPDDEAARALRVLPSGDRITVAEDGTLELDRSGTRETLGTGVEQVWSPPAPEAVPLW